MQKTIDAFFRLLEFLVVACMVAMVVMVFGNVVLRYAFNSGITVCLGRRHAGNKGIDFTRLYRGYFHLGTQRLPQRGLHRDTA